MDTSKGEQDAESLGILALSFIYYRRSCYRIKYTMSCEWFIFLIAAGIVLVVDLITLLLGWAFYKNAMAAYAETRGKLIKIVMFTVLAFVTLGGLYFGLALGAGGLCH